jgi:hypothetical protein
VILVVSTCKGLVHHHFDIYTACLNGELQEEEVYVRAHIHLLFLQLPIHTFFWPLWVQSILPWGRRERLRLQRALYGLLQPSRASKQCLERTLRATGFHQSEPDPLLWLLRYKGGRILVMFYVDDGLVTARTIAEADGLVGLVGSMLDIRELGEPTVYLGEPTDYLGVQITRGKAAGTITIHQTDKA